MSHSPADAGADALNAASSPPKIPSVPRSSALDRGQKPRGGRCVRSMNSSLAIFDIDGTLFDTIVVDDECFTKVAAELLQIQLEPSFWEGAPHLTDTGIVDWLWHRFRSRGPTAEEIEAFVAAYAHALAREHALAPDRFMATRDALPLLDLLPESCSAGLVSLRRSRLAAVDCESASVSGG